MAHHSCESVSDVTSEALWEMYACSRLECDSDGVLCCRSKCDGNGGVCMTRMHVSCSFLINCPILCECLRKLPCSIIMIAPVDQHPGASEDWSSNNQVTLFLPYSIPPNALLFSVFLRSAPNQTRLFLYDDVPSHLLSASSSSWDGILQDRVYK